MLAILFSLKTMESLQNGVATHFRVIPLFRVTPLFSMITEPLVSSQELLQLLDVNGPLTRYRDMTPFAPIVFNFMLYLEKKMVEQEYIPVGCIPHTLVSILMVGGVSA